MSPVIRSALTFAAGVVIALAFTIGPSLVRSGDEAVPTKTPKPGITAVSKEISTVPEVSPQRRKAVTKDIAKTLRGFYTRAFIQPAATPLPDASPRPKTTRRVNELLTKQARAAFADNSRPFDEASDLAVYTGDVAFEGMIVFDGRRPLEAFLEIDFGGLATPVGRSSPIVRVRQLGTLVLKNVDGRWFVDGFDLKFVTRPSPSPERTPS